MNKEAETESGRFACEHCDGTGDAATLRELFAQAKERALAAEAERDSLREALAAVKAAILSDMNGMAIQCTIFMPGGDAPPHETMVDFIDRALTQEQPNVRE